MCTEHVNAEVLIDSYEYGKMIKGYAKMSGCKTDVIEEGRTLHSKNTRHYVQMLMIRAC